MKATTRMQVNFSLRNAKLDFQRHFGRLDYQVVPKLANERLHADDAILENATFGIFM